MATSPHAVYDANRNSRASQRKLVKNGGEEQIKATGLIIAEPTQLNHSDNL